MTIYADQWEEMCYAKKAAEPSAENEVRQLYGRIAHHIFVSGINNPLRIRAWMGFR